MEEKREEDMEVVVDMEEEDFNMVVKEYLKEYITLYDIRKTT